MSDEITTPWQGDWQLRLKTKLASLGFDELEKFLEANPGTGYVKLAENLKDANVAAMQIYGLQVRKAVETGSLRETAIDCLVRFINEHVKRGWGNGRHFEKRAASAYAAWSTTISSNANDGEVQEKLKCVFDELEALQPKSGWLPSSSDDPIIVAAFVKGWPPETSKPPTSDAV